MSYCTECGSELDPDVTYCANCGAEVTETAVDEDIDDIEDDGTASLDGAVVEDGEDKTQWSVVIAAALFGLLPGFLLAWGFGTLGGSGIVFLIGWIGSTVYLRNKRLVSEVAGSGLYLSALILPVVPILFYAPNLTGEAQTAQEAGVQIGSFIGMFMYSIMFAIVGAVLAGIGYLAKKRAAKKLDAAG